MAAATMTTPPGRGRLAMAVRKAIPPVGAGKSAGWLNVSLPPSGRARNWKLKKLPLPCTSFYWRNSSTLLKRGSRIIYRSNLNVQSGVRMKWI